MSFNNWSDEKFLAWLAGFWEGEGHFRIYQNTGTKNKRCLSACFGITQKNKIILDEIKDKSENGKES